MSQKLAHERTRIHQVPYQRPVKLKQFSIRKSDNTTTSTDDDDDDDNDNRSHHRRRQIQSSPYPMPRLNADLARKYINLRYGSDRLDLRKSSEEFEDKPDDLINEERLDFLLEAMLDDDCLMSNWSSLKFCCWRGLMTRLMQLPYLSTRSHDRKPKLEYEFLAMRVCDINFIAEHKHSITDTHQRDHEDPKVVADRRFHSFNFEHLMTFDSSLDTNSEFITIVKSKLGRMGILLGGEVDAVLSDRRQDISTGELVELKLSKRPERNIKSFCRFKLLNYYLQSFLIGCENILVGLYSEIGFVEQIVGLETLKIPRLIRAECSSNTSTIDSAIVKSKSGTCLDWPFLSSVKQLLPSSYNHSESSTKPSSQKQGLDTRAFHFWDPNVCLDFGNRFLSWLDVVLAETPEVWADSGKVSNGTDMLISIKVYSGRKNPNKYRELSYKESLDERDWQRMLPENVWIEVSTADARLYDASANTSAHKRRGFLLERHIEKLQRYILNQKLSTK